MREQDLAERVANGGRRLDRHFPALGVAEPDLAALKRASDAEALRTALTEFDGVWGALDRDEQARVLALVLDEVVVDGATGEAELRFRGARS